MPQQQWDGKERRKSLEGLTVFEEIQILHNQFLAISDRITQHRESQERSFKELNQSIDNLTNLLFPHDGTDGMIQRIKNLEKSELQRNKQHENIIKIAIGSITALVGTILIWVWKLISSSIK